jgi:hypothetical protein
VGRDQALFGAPFYGARWKPPIKDGGLQDLQQEFRNFEILLVAGLVECSYYKILSDTRRV